MLQAIRSRLTYSNIAATLALVFAMSGGAYAVGSHGAVSKGSTSDGSMVATVAKSKAKDKTKTGARGPAGPKGATGATGPAGPAGLVGAAGAQGPAGATGAKGETGAQGPEGKEGHEGKAGANGTTGFTKVLPSGETLKGDWGLWTSVPTTGGGQEFLAGAVSFGIPLASAPAAVHIISAPTEKEEEEKVFPVAPQGCTGNVTEPGAEPGNLCVFAREEGDVKSGPAGTKVCATGASERLLECALSGGSTPESADATGFGFAVKAENAGLVRISGTWAVTAE